MSVFGFAWPWNAVIVVTVLFADDCVLAVVVGRCIGGRRK